nr:type III-B CRISPR-associated protein Cas10/Cmr2 [PVC group bacterium]
MQKNEQYWKEKLMAFLHDPPCKCFDIGRHEKIAASARRVAGISDEDYEAFQKEADWAASAADRFPFPPYKCSSKFTGDSEYPFKHPMGGSSLEFRNPVETAALAEEKFQKSIGGIPSELESWKDKFFLYWRRWPEESAKLDSRLAYLPADTRIPDHTIWTHMSLCSALQGCIENKKLKPAFMMFQLGPVQEFIAQAKSTRDLWSGSYLLSWLTAHAIKAVTDEVGPDSVIFPSLRGQPIFDLLHKDLYDSIEYKKDSMWSRMYKKDKDGESGINNGMRKLLTPTIPNRFCAIVPQYCAAEVAGKAEAAIKSELNKIGDVIWENLDAEG